MLCTRQDSIEPSTLEGIENLTSGDNVEFRRIGTEMPPFELGTIYRARQRRNRERQHEN